MGWRLRDLSRLDGKTVLVTGGGSGIGFQVAQAMSSRGAQVTILGRDKVRGAEALARLRGSSGSTEAARFDELDLASLASIVAFTARWGGRPVDFLMNVAGVMAIPERRLTSDGFEMHFGTNFLGHFALTSRLLPALRAGSARVVTVSALVGRWDMARLDIDDFQSAKVPYAPMTAYARSKLADIMFAVELGRRGRDLGISSVAVDPGTAPTNLQRHARGLGRSMSGILPRLIGYPLDRVAENVVFGAVTPSVGPSTLIGPSMMIQRFASPKDVGLPPLARDESVRRALWTYAEELTGLSYDDAAARAA